MSGRFTPRRVAGALWRRLRWAIVGRPTPPQLLEMVWPEDRLSAPPPVTVADGYLLRQYRPEDHDAYQALLASADMAVCPLDYWEKHLLPGGFFLIEHAATGELAAACFASHHPAPRHPRGGNFGWLATSPAHAGKGLGRAASAAVTARLVAGQYRRIYLETHDFRAPAIRIYLSMGWVPLLYAPEMASRWEAICEQIAWPFTPEAWPR